MRCLEEAKIFSKKLFGNEDIIDYLKEKMKNDFNLYNKNKKK